MLTPQSTPWPTRGSVLPLGANLDHLLPEQLEVVLANARRLQQAVHPSQRQALLRGRNLALICDAADAADAVEFREAASGLGAHVSHIRLSLPDLRTPVLLQHTARMLGRLYQGIECQGMPPDLVRQLGREAGIPVFDGLAKPGHTVARLATLLREGEPVEKDRHVILQALLMSTLG